MRRAECRYCGLEIDPSEDDPSAGVVRVGSALAHEACVFAGASDRPVDDTAAKVERDYQQARARGPIAAG